MSTICFAVIRIFVVDGYISQPKGLGADFTIQITDSITLRAHSPEEQSRGTLVRCVVWPNRNGKEGLVTKFTAKEKQITLLATHSFNG